MGFWYSRSASTSFQLFFRLWLDSSSLESLFANDYSGASLKTHIGEDQARSCKNLGNFGLLGLLARSASHVDHRHVFTSRART